MDYFSWLCMLAAPDGEKRLQYFQLLRDLMNTEYYWVIPRDENRAKDGRDLRDLYEEETGEVCEEGGPCTLFEMFLALAVRINKEIMYDPDEPDRISEWFWLMMEHLGVATFENESGHKLATKDIFDHFLNRDGDFFVEILEEKIKNDYCGGHFYPSMARKWSLLKTKLATDFKRKELWILVNRWLKEQYLVDFM